jgi:hypothetical protein
LHTRLPGFLLDLLCHIRISGHRPGTLNINLGDALIRRLLSCSSAIELIQGLLCRHQISRDPTAPIVQAERIVRRTGFQRYSSLSSRLGRSESLGTSKSGTGIGVPASVQLFSPLVQRQAPRHNLTYRFDDLCLLATCCKVGCCPLSRCTGTVSVSFAAGPTVDDTFGILLHFLLDRSHYCTDSTDGTDSTDSTDSRLLEQDSGGTDITDNTECKW